MNEEGRKRTKRGVATTIAALVLVVAGTLAYLADVASIERNAFDSEVDMHVEVLETSGNAYNIEPGMEDPKDPKAVVTTTAKAYTFLFVTDNTNGYIDYEIDSSWHKLTLPEDAVLPKASGDSYYNAYAIDDENGKSLERLSRFNGKIQASGDTVYTGDMSKYTVYYREVEASEDAQEFYILKDNRVSYPENVDISRIKKYNDEAYKGGRAPLSLDFQSYIVDYASFAGEPATAFMNLVGAMTDAKAELDSAAGASPEGEVAAALEAAKRAVDNATTYNEVQEALTLGKQAIERAKAA